MNDTHPTAGQLERYRSRTASPAELLEVDAHVATCATCFEQVRAGATSVVLPPAEHLTYAEMESYVDGRAELVDRELVDSHVARCEPCRNELQDLARVRDSMAPARPARLRWLAAAAAIVVAVLVAAWFVSRSTSGEPPVVRTASAPTATQPRPEPIATPDSTATSTAIATPIAISAAVLTRPAILDTLRREPRVLRGTQARNPFALQSPVATVVIDDRPNFRWSAARDVESYDVAVADAESGSVAATGSTTTNWWRPDAPLPRGRTYSWQVTAHIGGDTIVVPGPSGAEALFHVASSAVATEVEKEKKPLDRGVALAQHGALDEAEAVFESAANEGESRARPLLEQVRSWRADSYRALPTTTNGAQ